MLISERLSGSSSIDWLTLYGYDANANAAATLTYPDGHQVSYEKNKCLGGSEMKVEPRFAWGSAEFLLMVVALFTLIPFIPSDGESIPWIRIYLISAIVWTASRVCSLFARDRNIVFPILEMITYAVFAAGILARIQYAHEGAISSWL